jgi:hypothetical protein
MALEVPLSEWEPKPENNGLGQWLIFGVSFRSVAKNLFLGKSHKFLKNLHKLLIRYYLDFRGEGGGGLFFNHLKNLLDRL